MASFFCHREGQWRLVVAMESVLPACGIKVGDKDLCLTAKAMAKAGGGLDCKRTFLTTAMNGAIGPIPLPLDVHLREELQIAPGEDDNLLSFGVCPRGKGCEAWDVLLP